MLATFVLATLYSICSGVLQQDAHLIRQEPGPFAFVAAADAHNLPRAEFVLRVDLESDGSVNDVTAVTPAFAPSDPAWVDARHRDESRAIAQARRSIFSPQVTACQWRPAALYLAVRHTEQPN